MNRLLSRLLCAFAVTLSPSALAQAQTGTSSSEGVTAQVDKVFALFDKPDSPGCALAVIKGGQIVYKRGYGMADLDHDIPIRPDTVFHVASVSKQFAAMAVMLLAKQGKLSLDDAEPRHRPGLKQRADQELSFR
jgi:CubicO group peptidase (beta-lactamase class C family)